MIEQLIEMMNTVLKEDELWALSAQLVKKSVDALVNAGFTREEAIKIVANNGPIVKASN